MSDTHCNILEILLNEILKVKFWKISNSFNFKTFISLIVFVRFQFFFLPKCREKLNRVK